MGRGCRGRGCSNWNGAYSLPSRVQPRLYAYQFLPTALASRFAGGRNAQAYRLGRGKGGPAHGAPPATEKQFLGTATERRVGAYQFLAAVAALRVACDATALGLPAAPPAGTVPTTWFELSYPLRLGMSLHTQ
ncbi:MAG: hypothetical protein ACI91B_004136 [Planctomycetota bacterium]|jgi:hypothetical protein